MSRMSVWRRVARRFAPSVLPRQPSLRANATQPLRRPRRRRARRRRRRLPLELTLFLLLLALLLPRPALPVRARRHLLLPRQPLLEAAVGATPLPIPLRCTAPKRVRHRPHHLRTSASLRRRSLIVLLWLVLQVETDRAVAAVMFIVLRPVPKVEVAAALERETEDAAKCIVPEEVTEIATEMEVVATRFVPEEATEIATEMEVVATRFVPEEVTEIATEMEVVAMFTVLATEMVVVEEVIAMAIVVATRFVLVEVTEIATETEVAVMFTDLVTETVDVVTETVDVEEASAATRPTSRPTTIATAIATAIVTVVLDLFTDLLVLLEEAAEAIGLLLKEDLPLHHPVALLDPSGQRNKEKQFILFFVLLLFLC